MYGASAPAIQLSVYNQRSASVLSRQISAMCQVTSS
jgi:hypothetical protein